MADLYARIDGEYVPLTDCAWALCAPCGCVLGVNVAASADGERVYATPAAGLAAFGNEDVSAVRLRHAGYRVELMHFETAGKALVFRCKHEEEKARA